MAISVVMPALEMAQETGKLLAWRKREGDAVAKGEILLEIETDKAVMEIEAPGDGILAGIRVQAGAEIPVGQTLAWLVGPGETPPQEDPPAPSGRAMAREPAVSGNAARTGIATQEGRISPKARRLARELGVEISSLCGSGPGGAIIEKDILAAVKRRRSTLRPSDENLSTIARLMAERTTDSWTTIPHFYVNREVDAGALVELRGELSAQLETAAGVQPSYTDLFLFVAARVLTRHPAVNASWIDGGIRRNADINISLAIAVETGVVTAVLHRADKLDLSELSRQRREAAERARSGKLRPVDVSGGTFTISNLGMYQVDAFSAIITPPQAAVLALGRIRERIVPVDHRAVVRPTLTMTLSCDHRVVDGARAAMFLDDLVHSLHQPKSLLA
ncbi:MAG: 2-oxo acid dehydrogenase subunit E2 [Acidobacteria bacterium]|nr:2-oxo acid dehydrogenase subunit E2 [Acidobacteriota bacterium]